MVKRLALYIFFLLLYKSSFSQDSTHVFYAWPVQSGSETIQYRYKGDSLRLKNGNFNVMNMMDKSVCLFSGSFKNSKKNGTWTFYHDGVQISSVQNYRNDTLDGMGRTYDKEGTIISEITYVNGEMHGPFFWKDFVTNLGFAYGQFNHNDPAGIWQYKESGQLLMEVDYSNGKKNQVISRYKNGALYQRETYKNLQLVKTETW